MHLAVLVQIGSNEVPDVIGNAVFEVDLCVRDTIWVIAMKFGPASFLNVANGETASARGVPSEIKRPGVIDTAHGAFKDPTPFLLADPILAMHNVLATDRDFSSIANLGKASKKTSMGRHAPRADVTAVITSDQNRVQLPTLGLKCCRSLPSSRFPYLTVRLHTFL